MNLYRSLLAFLASLSADPAEIDREHPRAAAAVAAAYATFAPDEAPQPPPAPAACACGGKCQGGTFKPDGQIVMQCDPTCPCGCRKAGTAKPCATCPAPAAASAKPAGSR